MFEAMDAGARSPQPRSHRFSRVRVGRIRDRVKRSVAADHVAILVEPIAIGIVRAASRAERMIDRLRLVELARHLVAVKPALQSSEVGLIIDHAFHLCHSLFQKSPLTRSPWGSKNRARFSAATLSWFSS